jgi:hypothetical protein
LRWFSQAATPIFVFVKPFTTLPCFGWRKAFVGACLMVKTTAASVNAMSNSIRWRDCCPLLPLLLAASIIVLPAVAVAVIWSRSSLTGDDHALSFDRMKGAYDKVQPGRTSEPELAALGFDQARYKARLFSGLGVQEYFMPHTSVDFDRMAPAVQSCFDASDRCTALIFPIASSRVRGFMAANAWPRQPARMIFLIKSGRVTYKALQG